MKKWFSIRGLIPAYLGVFVLVVGLSIAWSKTASAFNEQAPFVHNHTVIIDAGHGEPDGGATSCTGVTEDVINLEISKRLDDLMHLMGIHTVMVRSDENSVYTEGESIAKKKVSDLKNRVDLVNNTNNPILISIHQNYFSDSRYSGAQVFYSDNTASMELAGIFQKAFISSLNPTSHRQPKTGRGIYLLDHVDCTAVLIECGFLSNPKEEQNLRSDAYQKKISCVIAASLSTYMNP